MRPPVSPTSFLLNIWPGAPACSWFWSLGQCDSLMPEAWAQSLVSTRRRNDSISTPSRAERILQVPQVWPKNKMEKCLDSSLLSPIAVKSFLLQKTTTASMFNLLFSHHSYVVLLETSGNTHLRQSGAIMTMSRRAIRAQAPGVSYSRSTEDCLKLQTEQYLLA